MRVGYIRKALIFVPIAAGVISTILFLVQGGFGGGHSPLDFLIVALGFPSILLPIPSSMAIPDILLVVWIPSLLNALLFFLLGSFLTKLILAKKVDES